MKPLSLICPILLCVASVATSTDASEYVLEAARVNSTIRVDGLLDDPTWLTADRITTFTQYSPEDSAACTESTWVAATIDEKNLYLCARCYDSGTVTARFTRRDNVIVDQLAFELSPFNDGRNGYHFCVSPTGAQEDATVFDATDMDFSFDAVWVCEARVDSLGWTVEIAIPFASLRYPEGGGGEWGFQVQRSIISKQEHAAWVPVQPGEGFWDMSRMGVLEGIENIPSRLGLDLLPYASGDVAKHEPDDPDYGGQFGLDVKFVPRSDFALDLTVNPDFGQVEADEERIHLSQYEQWFDERRPFFLEGSDLFDVPFATLVYTRRIGRLLPDGETVPIIAGAKTTANVSGFRSSVMLAQTAEKDYESWDGDETEPARTFGIVRITRNVGEYSTVGMIATTREEDGGHARSYGGDVGLRLFDRDLSVDAAYYRLSVTGTPDDGAYFGAAEVEYQSGRQGVGGEYYDIGESFDIPLGYIGRVAQRWLWTWAWTSWRPNGNIIRSWGFDYNAGRLWDIVTDRRLGQSVHGSAWLSTPNYYGFGCWFSDWKDWDRDFSGEEYEGFDYGFWVDNNWQDPLYVNLDVDVGDHYDGTYWSYGVYTELKYFDRMQFSASRDFIRTDLPDEGITDYGIWRVRGTCFLSRDAYVRLLYQISTSECELYPEYDDRLHLADVLFAWRYLPGSTFYIAFKEARDNTAGGYELLDRQVIAKVTYLFRM
jgi:hypothetical protein